MKHLNFLSTIGKAPLESSSSDIGRRYRVVTDFLPSFCRVNMLKFVSILTLFLIIGAGNVWGACYLQSFNGSTSDASTNFSTQNVASGSAGRVSWTTSGVTYSSNNFQMGANSSMTISVSSGYVITKVETSTTTGSPSYYGSLTSSTVTPTVASQKNYTFSNINASSITINNGSTTYRITSNGWVKVYYEEASSCDKKVTISAGTPEAGGSFQLNKTGEQDNCSGLTIAVSNITAPSGKRFSAITQEGIASGVEISQSAKTVTYAANTTGSSTINVTYEDKGCTDHGASSITGGALSDADHGPVHAYYDYSTSQFLYTKSDLDLAAGKKGTIKSIYFEYSGAAAMAARTIKIYMANTDLSSLTTSNYVPYASFTQVYSGTFSCGSAGWYEITLDTPFDYNGAGQLAVMIDDNTNTYESSKSFKYHSATGKQIYKRQDDTDIDPASWTPAYAIDYRPNTKFCIQEADMTQYTVNWYVNNSETPAHTQTGYAGVALTDIPAPTKSNCDGNKEFVGWYTDEYEHATNAPAFVSPATIPDGGANYYAVFANTSVGDPVETTLWSEDFNVASGTAPIAPTGITYTCTNGGSDTKIYDDSNCPKGGTCKNLLIGKSTGSFLVEGIPTQGAQSLTLSFSKGGSGTLTVSSPTSNVSVSGSTSGSTITIGQNNVSTFDLLFSNSSSNNLRIVDIAVSAEVAPVTYSNYATTCCQSLGSINGSVTLTQDANGKLKATWPPQTTTDGWAANGIKITFYDSNNNQVAYSTALANNTTTYTATDFTPGKCATYYATLTAIHGDDATYCSGNVEGAKPAAQYHCTTAGYSVNVTGVTHVTPNTAFPATTCSSGFSRTISAEAGYELPESITVSGASYTWNNGALTISNVTADVTITIPGQEISDPEITAAPASVTFDAVDQGANVPAATTFTITGANLEGNLSMTSAQESDPFTWAIADGDGSLEKDENDEVHATVTVTPKSGITATAGTKQATITISGGGATSVNVPISLTVQPRYTVSFSTGEGNPAQASIQEASYNAGITLPAGPTPVCSVDDWAFAGWAESVVGSKTSTAPTLLPNETYHPSGNVTLYAVYTKDEADGNTAEYTLVSSAANFTDGTYVAAALDNGSYYFMNGTYVKDGLGVESTGLATTSVSEGKFGEASLPTGAIEIEVADDEDPDGDNHYYFISYSDGDNTYFMDDDDDKQTLTWTTNTTVWTYHPNFTQNATNGCVLLSGSGSKVSENSTNKTSSIRNYASDGGAYYRDIYFFKKSNTGTTTYYWSAPTCCTKKVTITKGEDPEHGSFTIDKDGVHLTCDGSVAVVVTPTPDTHYRVNTVSATTGETGIDNGDGTWTITYAQNTNAASTINVTFVIKTQYTVTWNNNGSTSTSQVYDGEQPVFPTPAPTSCDDEGGSEAFYGWATDAWTGKKALNEIGATIYTSANSMPAVTGAVTYYAVFAKKTPVVGDDQTITLEYDDFDLTTTYAEHTANVSEVGFTVNQGYKGTGNVIQMNNSKGNGTLYNTTAINGLKSVAVNVSSGSNTYYVTTGTTQNPTANSQSGTSTGTYNAAAGDGYFQLRVTGASYFSSIVVTYAPVNYEYSQFMTTCCTKHNVTIDSEIENGTVTASPASACEGATVTLTFTPNQSHHLSAWTLGGVEQDLAVNTFTMPDEAVTVSAVFEHDPCTNLAAPTLDGTVAVTYNSATINWNTVTNASSYDVTVIRHEDSESIFSGNVNALTKALAELDAETRYDYSIMAVGDGTDFCATGNGLLQGNFTTSELPTAHLTLNDANGTHASSGDYTILTPFNLPDEAASCSKTFIGWDADEECATAPTYAKGAEFTFANTTGVTLYAVYADVTGGGTSTTNIAYSGNTGNMVEGNNAETFELDPNEWSIVPAQGGNSNYPGLNGDGDIRLYYHANGGNTLTITAPQTIVSVGLTFTGPGYSNAWVKVGGEAVELSDGVYPINATSFVIGNANTSNTQVRISNIAVNFNVPGTPSNYSTACLAAPVATPSVNNLNDVVAAGTSGTITMTYENVKTAGIAVSVCTDAQGNVPAGEGFWLTASLNASNNIAYSIAENTSYNEARTAYIKLIAPETNEATTPDVVIIPVSQVKKPAVFASLQDLVIANVNSGTTVTVSFSDVIIDSKASNGIYFAIQKENANIEIYYASETVPASWQAGGSVSGTMTCQWKRFVQSNVFKCWELQPANNSWAWESEDPNIGLTYAAPKTVESIAIKAGSEPSQKTYADGATLNPTGMTVTFNYTDKTSKDITSTDPEWANIEWTFDPETLSEGTDVTVSVTAEYNDISSAEFNVTGITVTGIPTLTTQQFIAAGGTRCYLEGVMSNVATGNAYKYGNFDLTDESGSIYVYGCLTADGETEKFGTIGIGNCDKVKVLAENYTYYNKHEAVNVRYVEKLAQSAASVSLDEDAKEIRVGQSFTLTETVLPCGADNKSVTWASSDNAIATVENGVVTAVSAGNATITVTTVDGGYTTTCDVTVKPVFNVTYNTSGSKGTTPVDANTYVENDEVTLLSASGLSNAGYFFDKWVATYVDNNSDIQTLEIEDGKFTMPAFDVTVTATWARKSSDKWIKVTSVSALNTIIAANASEKFIIVNEEATFAMGEQKTNNRGVAEIEESNGIVKGSDAMAQFTISIPETGKYAFHQEGEGYLYASSSSKNNLNSQTTNDDNGKWTISMTGEGVATLTATGDNTRNVLHYNPNTSGNSPLFSCYASNSSVTGLVAIYMKAPVERIEDGQTINSSTIPENADVIVENGGVLNIDDAKQIGDLTVEAGGKVALDANKLTVVGTFTIETTMASGESGQLTGATASNFAANGDAYIDITLGESGRADQWHAFTVPFPVDVMNGIYDLAGKKLTNEVNYAIMDYHGDIRATGKYGWKKYRGVLVPGTFYLMTVDGERTTYRFKKTADGALVAGNTKPLYEYASTTGNNDNGWNGVGNPTLRYGQVAYKVQVLNPTSYTYEPFEANETNFVVGTPFFIQANAAAASAGMTFGAASGEANYAPARTPAKGIESVKVTFGNEEYKDRLYISASEDALNEYETGKDLVKMTMTSTPKVAQIFGKAYNAKLCMVYAPMSNGQAVYDLSLYAPANGEYTIAAPSAEADVYLTYEGAIIWNLSESAYPMDLKKGTTEGYGLLLNAKMPQTPTGVDNIDASEAAQKVIINNHVYILRNGQMYGVDGKAVR